MSKLFVFLLRNKNCKKVKSLPRVTSPCKAVAGIRSHLVYPETDQFPFWYKLFVESSQPAPNQYRKADDSSLLCVEMGLCNLAMNRIERVLLHHIHKPKDIRSISWMFLCYMAVLND